MINEDSGRSMRSIARELKMSNSTVRTIVNENIRYKSYVIRRGQFLSRQLKERRLEKAKKLLSKLKNPERKKYLNYFLR